MRVTGDIRIIARSAYGKDPGQGLRKRKEEEQVSTLRERIRKERETIAQKSPEVEYLDTLRRVIPRKRQPGDRQHPAGILGRVISTNPLRPAAW